MEEQLRDHEHHLSFLEGVWFVHRLYQENLDSLAELYDCSPASDHLRTVIEEMDDELRNNVLLEKLNERSQDLRAAYKIDLMSLR